MDLALLSTFGTVLLTVFIAEMGDKTQLLMIAMAKKYKIRDILIGVGLSIIVLNVMAVAVGSLLGNLLPTTIINLIAGVAFFYFATAALLSGDDDEAVKEKGRFGAIVSTFGIFFLGELGDKTQLTALALSAGESADGFSFPTALMVFLGATLALFAADAIGLVVGYFLGKSIPNWIFGWLSYILFAGFGIMKLLDGFYTVGENGVADGLFSENYLNLNGPVFWQIVCTCVLTLAFVAVSLFLKFRPLKHKAEELTDETK